jgi:hypothetical protein
MNLVVVRAFTDAARSCAFVMLENALYIERELPQIPLDDALRAQTAHICSALIGTKHDILSEVEELHGRLGHDTSDAEVAKYIERIVRWLGDDVAHLDELVAALDAARQRDATATAACVLVTESAASILAAYARTKSAAAGTGSV